MGEGKMKFPFRYKGVHYCGGAAIFCVDFRFVEETLEWLRSNYGSDFDIWTMPGGCKILASDDEADRRFAKEWLQKMAAVSCGLHGIKKLAVINHADCGAYGGRKAFGSILAEKEKHSADLKKSRTTVLEALSAVEYIPVYADLDEGQTSLTIDVI